MLKYLFLTLLFISSQALALPKAYLVYDQERVYYYYGQDSQRSIASLTKMMTAIVFMENNQNQQCSVFINTTDDKDRLKNTHTRLKFNKEYFCSDLVYIMLISSDNVAASALSRSIPGWTKQAFVAQMNARAKQMGMSATRFADPSGLSPENKSTAADLSKLMYYFASYDALRKISSQYGVRLSNEAQKTDFVNTNRLVRTDNKETIFSKTGYIKESGYNLIYGQRNSCGKSIFFIILGATSSVERSEFVRNNVNVSCNQ